MRVRVKVYRFSMILRLSRLNSSRSTQKPSKIFPIITSASPNSEEIQSNTSKLGYPKCTCENLCTWGCVHVLSVQRRGALTRDRTTSTQRKRQPRCTHSNHASRCGGLAIVGRLHCTFEWDRSALDLDFGKHTRKMESAPRSEPFPAPITQYSAITTDEITRCFRSLYIRLRTKVWGIISGGPNP